MRTLLLLAILAVAALLTLGLFTEYRGVGSFGQEVLIEAPKTVKSVEYFCCEVDEEIRRRAENTADPKMFDLRETQALGGNRYLAQVRFTSRSNAVFDKVFYSRHLVVYIEFDDGTRACRVVELPRNCGRDLVTVRIVDDEGG